VIRSPNELAHASYFSGSRASLIMGFTCGTFDLELVKLDVTDCVHDNRGEKDEKPNLCEKSVTHQSLMGDLSLLWL